jgi:plasmid maintenance system antidote protein VapI
MPPSTGHNGGPAMEDFNVSAALAVRLGALLGNGAGLWLRMQGAYDVWHAEHEVDVSGNCKLEAA